MREFRPEILSDIHPPLTSQELGDDEAKIELWKLIDNIPSSELKA
jgi:hypothetical protein